MADSLSPDQLGARLAEVYRVVGPLYRTVARVVEHDEPTMGMSTGVRAVLDQLSRDGDLTVPSIAATQELSRQFVQRMVHDARTAGFVELLDNPAHRRSSLITLTDAGRSAIDAVTQREQRLMGRVAGDLTSDDVDTTVRVLSAMLDGLTHDASSR